MTRSQRMAMGEEEFDVVKSLELTAEGSWKEGYRKGVEDMQEAASKEYPLVEVALICIAEKLLKDKR